MARPGTEIVIREVPPPRSAPTDTGVWFVAGFSEKGPIVPTLIQSMSDFQRHYGIRVSYGMLYDALESYFREGGRRAYVSRVFGPNPVAATRNLLDGAAAITLVATAINPGDWSNDVDIAVVAGSVGGTFVLVIREGAVEVERSPDLLDQAAAIAWAANSDYIRLTAGASALDPAVAAAALLVGGTDDRSNATDATWLTALNKFDKTLGPGQVSYPGRATTVAHGDLLAHAEARNRTAILDLPDSGSKATQLGAAGALNVSDRHGGGFAPWYIVPGVTQGTTRTVPPSGIVSGIMARNDVRYSPNVPAAGELGESVWAVGLSQPEWNDADRQQLNEAGVNVIRTVYGGIRVYGYRTLASPITDFNWINLGNKRLVMAIMAQGQNILESFVFDQIDGRGRKFAELNGELTAMCQRFYEEDSLYGATPGEAFAVDTGAEVNTPETISNNEIHAVIALRMSPMGEWVKLELVKVPTTESVS